MKVTNLSVLLALSALISFRVFAAEPVMIADEKKVNRDGKELIEKTWKIKFPNANLVFKRTIGPDNKLVHSKWGDSFFGLSMFGKDIGWSPWNFITILDAKGKNMLAAEPPESVVMSKFNEGALVKITWKTGYVKLLHLYNNKDWLFVKVDFPKDMKAVSLCCYPGGSDWGVAGRERRMKIGEQDLELTKQMKKISFRESDCGLALYNRNYKEQFGNFLVFEPAKFASLEGSSYNAVNLTFNFKPEVTSATFAFSAFANENPSEAIPRFLVERLSNIRDALASTPWDPKMDFSEFKSKLEQVRQLIAELKPELKTTRAQELEQISAAFSKAEAAQNVEGCAKALESLRALEKKVGVEGMAGLK